MKLLLGCVLLVLLSGCIPIGIQGKTLAIAAPGSVAAARLAGADRQADFAVSQHDGLKTVARDGRELVSCGRPISGTEVKVVDDEIWLRCPTSITAYLDGAPIGGADGYFPSGDLGAVIDGEVVVFGFCVVGPESSLPYVCKRILELGKTFVHTNNLNLPGQRISDADFDCVLQTGSWGRPVTEKPVFQLFNAGWDPALQPGIVNGVPITDPQWFHELPTDVLEELADPKNVLWPLASATVGPSLTWRS